MNKKKFSYVLFIVFLFSFFNVEAKAATAISCAYYDEKYNEAYKIVQKSDGTGAIYEGQKSKVVMKDGTIEWTGFWTEKKELKNLFWFKSCGNNKKDNNVLGTELQKSDQKTLTKCPGHLIRTSGKYYLVDELGFDIKKSCAYSNIIGDYGFKDDVPKAYTESSTIGDQEGSKENNNKCSEITDKWIDKNSKSYASCLYSIDIEDQGCMILQLDFTKQGAFTYKTTLPKNITGTRTPANSTSSSFNVYHMKENYDCSCPEGELNVSYEYKPQLFTYEFSFGIEDRKSKWLPMKFEEASGKNLCDPSKDMTAYEYEGYNLNFIFGEKITCADIIGEDGDLVDILNMLVKLVKIGIPILLIVLGVLDFVKAIFAGEESGMKKAQGKFIKRLIIGVAIFLVPSLLHFILEIANNIWPVIDADLCGIL